MKILIFLAPTLLILQMAVASPDAKQKPVPSKKASSLGTSFRFDGSSLHGKYQSSPGLTSTVENDKYLEDLLGARKNFDDRNKKDLERN